MIKKISIFIFNFIVSKSTYFSLETYILIGLIYPILQLQNILLNPKFLLYYNGDLIIYNTIYLFLKTLFLLLEFLI